MLRIHPKYLTDARLLSLWREALAGQRKIASGGQWADFEQCGCALKVVGAYLSFIASEGLGRGIKLNHELITLPNFDEKFLSVSKQVLWEEQIKLNIPVSDNPRSNPVYKIV